MTTLLRRPLSLSLSIGLAASLSLGSPLALAAPPDEVPEDDDAVPEDDVAAPEDDDAAPEDDDAAPEELPPEPEPEPEPEPMLESPAENEPRAQPPPSGGMDPKHSVVYTSLLAPRINPLGLEERLWIGYQYRLYNKDKAILNGSNVGIFFRPILNPAIALIGATIQFQPAAVLRFRATYSFVQWFGTFQFFQSYQSPYDDYSETRLSAQADAGQNYVTNGHQVELEALLQARYKGLVIRSSLFGVYNHYDPRGDDDVFYQVRWEVLSPAQGWLLANDTDVLWLHDFKNARRSTLMVGARATTLMPFFPKDVYEEGDVVKNPVGPQFRLGPALGYIFYDRPDRKFNKPTLLMMPQWNIKHRWRTGRDVISAYPTIVIAFVFSGQLWGKG